MALPCSALAHIIPLPRPPAAGRQTLNPGINQRRPLGAGTGDGDADGRTVRAYMNSLEYTIMFMTGKPALFCTKVVMLLPGRVHTVWLPGAWKSAMQEKVSTVGPQPVQLNMDVMLVQGAPPNCAGTTTSLTSRWNPLTHQPLRRKSLATQSIGSAGGGDPGGGEAGVPGGGEAGGLGAAGVSERK